MSPYTVTIENENNLSNRNIFIENDDGARIESYEGEEDIEIHQGAFDTTLYLTKESFLELYELMTVLKKYIDNEWDKPQTHSNCQDNYPSWTEYWTKHKDD